ncbi:hypothetical protein BN970_01358 [Mycolicibacterium conceptionense]|uniref:SPOR domain-containing protein n=1 Tax=Mycolicibacterium conceptionense TaxID=451644 RepID=A0A0U1D306_9MYCO|nr:hypothetical protein [Mycolicibacterium conceptionense]ORV20956.1 hypothetical protein AWB98_01260 [Mycolicibacterium conceptionense]CQD07228.1 hypothetical protein BN970_01358 [Mycolicibacterium conceptionense]
MADDPLVSSQFAVRYANHRAKGKAIQLGNYSTEAETTDIARDLKRQGYEPEVITRTVTVTYTDWAPVTTAKEISLSRPITGYTNGFCRFYNG